MVVYEGRSEVGSRKAITASIITALHPLVFKAADKERVEYKGVEKDPDHAHHELFKGGVINRPEFEVGYREARRGLLPMKTHVAATNSRNIRALQWRLPRKQSLD